MTIMDMRINIIMPLQKLEPWLTTPVIPKISKINKWLTNMTVISNVNDVNMVIFNSPNLFCYFIAKKPINYER
jgi:hypothetical protein